MLHKKIAIITDLPSSFQCNRSANYVMGLVMERTKDSRDWKRQLRNDIAILDGQVDLSMSSGNN